MRNNESWNSEICLSPRSSHIAFLANAQLCAYSGKDTIEPITITEVYRSEPRWRRSGVQ